MTGTPGTVPDLEALSLSRPESAIYLKCPGFPRLLLLSWDNRVQTSSTTLETIWLESLNHVSFMHSAVYLVANDQLAVLQFCGWGSPAKSYTEHAHEATA